MTIQELVKTGKAGRIRSKGEEYGKIQENPNGRILLVRDTGEAIRALSLLEVFSEEWEVERLPRVFYLGAFSVQSHDKMVNVIRAIESDKVPEHKTVDGSAWIKVVEIMD